MRIHYNHESKLVKSGAPQNLTFFRTKNTRAFIFVANDRYKLSLRVSISSKASNVCSHWEVLLKVGQYENMVFFNFNVILI